jgi:hypothetical protein
MAPFPSEGTPPLPKVTRRNPSLGGTALSAQMSTSLVGHPGESQWEVLIEEGDRRPANVINLN